MKIRLVDKRSLSEPDAQYYQVQVLEDGEDENGEWRCRDGSTDLEKATEMFDRMGTPPFNTIHGDYIVGVLKEKTVETARPKDKRDYPLGGDSDYGESVLGFGGRHHYDAPDGYPCSCGRPIDDPIHIPRLRP